MKIRVGKISHSAIYVEFCANDPTSGTYCTMYVLVHRQYLKYLNKKGGQLCPRNPLSDLAWWPTDSIIPRVMCLTHNTLSLSLVYVCI